MIARPHRFLCGCRLLSTIGMCSTMWQSSGLLKRRCIHNLSQAGGDHLAEIVSMPILADHASRIGDWHA